GWVCGWPADGLIEPVHAAFRTDRRALAPVPRARSTARWRRLGLALPLLAGLALAGAGFFLAARSHDPKHSSATREGATTERRRHTRPDPHPTHRVPHVRLAERRTGALDAPTQDAAVADAGHRGLLLIGGLPPADTP